MKFHKVFNVIKLINVKVFLISLALGLFFVYVTKPEQKIIIVYPNPSNNKKIHYKDKSDNCFEFNEVEVSCPDDSSLITDYNVQ
tara:strand:+ start:51 stop:302 length:252 start_codon:yes stop_codon:yes gene_type:complete